MTTTTFDTLAYSNALQQAGMPKAQAEALTRAQADALRSMLESRDLATKNDLLELKHDILKWMVGLALAQITLAVALFAIR
jgi:hypothetical protein